MVKSGAGDALGRGKKGERGEVQSGRTRREKLEKRINTHHLIVDNVAPPLEPIAIRSVDPGMIWEESMYVDGSENLVYNLCAPSVHVLVEANDCDAGRPRKRPLTLKLTQVEFRSLAPGVG